MAPVGILITMTMLMPTRALHLCAAFAVAAFPGWLGAQAQEVVLSPGFTTPVAGQPLPYNLVNHGTDTVSICLTNGWSALGVQGTSAFTVERRIGGKWHKVLGKDLRNQLAQPIAAGQATSFAMAGLGEPGTYRLEVNYVHGLVPTCWAPHEGKIHVLHTDSFDLSDAPAVSAAPKAGPEPTPELKPRPDEPQPTGPPQA